MKCLLLLIFGIVICVVAGGIIKDQLDDNAEDLIALFAGILLILMGIMISIAAMHMYGEKIESKTPIRPDVTVVIENGVSDTTYVYRR